MVVNSLSIPTILAKAVAHSQDKKQSNVPIIKSILITHREVSASQLDIVICHIHDMPSKVCSNTDQIDAKPEGCQRRGAEPTCENTNTGMKNEMFAHEFVLEDDKS